MGKQKIPLSSKSLGTPMPRYTPGTNVNVLVIIQEQLRYFLFEIDDFSSKPDPKTFNINLFKLKDKDYSF